MRIMLIALATLATTAIAMPIVSHAEDTVIIKKKDRDHGWRHRDHDKKTVIIKERDRDHDRHYHSTTTGSGLGVGVGVHVGN